MKLRRFGAVLVFAVILALGQDVHPVFDVASIHPQAPDDNSFFVRPPVRGHFTATGSVAKLLVMLAYSVQDSQIIGGPSWFDTEKWDIEAKRVDHVQHSDEETRRMLQNLLAERFSLSIHRETRPLPVYVLGVAKGGPKFKAQENDGRANAQITGNSIRIRTGEISQLAQFLSSAVGRPVIDRTGLGDRYDLSVTWDDAPIRNGGVPGLDVPSTRGDYGSVFTAVEKQLGLRLYATRTPVEVILIDHIERPSEN